MKFKVGDTVKVISPNMSASGRIYNGQIGKIIRATAEFNSPRNIPHYLLNIEVIFGGIYEDELIFVSTVKKIIKPYPVAIFLGGLK